MSGHRGPVPAQGHTEDFSNVVLQAFQRFTRTPEADKSTASPTCQGRPKNDNFSMRNASEMQSSISLKSVSGLRDSVIR